MRAPSGVTTIFCSVTGIAPLSQRCSTPASPTRQPPILCPARRRDTCGGGRRGCGRAVSEQAAGEVYGSPVLPTAAANPERGEVRHEGLPLQETHHARTQVPGRGGP